ncbi:hypothetical protein [Azospirillum sp.]|uniref:hypothetical protein n=1 Tax=Azospirillum sp. TaxID=34012 RepID=UPI002D751E56|nr:hypothetical protein [Azospirillum sp.]HYD64530.1 hypothetical protein [Azospirillum sp.]
MFGRLKGGVLLRRAGRGFALVALGALLAGAVAQPAAAGRDHGWGHGRGHGHHQRHWRPGPPAIIYGAPPPVYYAPPPVYYAPPPRVIYAPPPPVVYAPPSSLNIVVPLRFD